MTRVAPADLLALGVQMAALGLIAGSVFLIITGTARPLGESFRSTIEPILQIVRDHTTMSRGQLADSSLMVAIGLAAASAVIEQEVMAVFATVGLWLARPSLQRAMREENRLLALGGLFSVDLVIGIYTPVMFAQFLTGEILLGSCLLAVVVALSWPAGGGGPIPGRRWRLAPVAP